MTVAAIKWTVVSGQCSRTTVHCLLLPLTNAWHVMVDADVAFDKSADLLCIHRIKFQLALPGINRDERAHIFMQRLIPTTAPRGIIRCQHDMATGRNKGLDNCF